MILSSILSIKTPLPQINKSESAKIIFRVFCGNVRFDVGKFFTKCLPMSKRRAGEKWRSI